MDGPSHFRLDRPKSPRARLGRSSLDSRTDYRCRSSYNYNSRVDDFTTTKSYFRGWPRRGRAGLERFDKTRIDAGTPHGLPRVTVNGISSRTTQRRNISSSITILILILLSRLKCLLLSLGSISEPHSYFRLSVSRLLTRRDISISYSCFIFLPNKEFRV